MIMGSVVHGVFHPHSVAFTAVIRQLRNNEHSVWGHCVGQRGRLLPAQMLAAVLTVRCPSHSSPWQPIKLSPGKQNVHALSYVTKTCL